MSWDVYLIKSAANDEATPDEVENPVPVATKSEVYDWLRQNYPEVDLTGEGCPVLFAEEYSVEFVLDEEEQQDQIWLIIRGDEAPYELIEAMCRAFDCRAVDTGTGGFLEGKETSSFEEWKDFREQVKAEYEAADEKGWRGMLRSLCGWFTGR